MKYELNYKDGKKYCAGCQSYKAPDEFCKRARSADGLQGRCTKCQVAYKVKNDREKREQKRAAEEAAVMNEYPEPIVLTDEGARKLAAMILREGLEAYRSPHVHARELNPQHWYKLKPEYKQLRIAEVRADAAAFLASPRCDELAEFCGTSLEEISKVKYPAPVTRKKTWNDTRAAIVAKYGKK